MVEPNDDDATHHGSFPTEADITRISGGGSSDDHDAALADLRSDLSIEDLRRRRRQQEWSRREVTPTSVLAGSIGERVTLWLSTGTELFGTVTEVGTDYVCLDTGRDHTWIRIAETTGVRTEMDPATMVSDPPTLSATLIDVIEDLMMAEVTVSVVLRGGARTSGTPLTIGESLMIRDDRGHTVLEPSTVVAISRAS